MPSIRTLMRVTAGISLAALAMSCATIMNGSSQKISLQSNPDAAKITVTNKYGQVVASGTTPVTIKLKRGAGFFSSGEYTVRFEKPGYAPRDFTVDGSMSGWYIGGNILLGGWVGWLIVDPATGGMWKLSPKNIKAEMSLQQGAIWNNNSGLTVVLLEDVPQEYTKYMEPVSAE